jgi:hypothetical protein
MQTKPIPEDASQKRFSSSVFATQFERIHTFNDENILDSIDFHRFRGRRPDLQRLRRALQSVLWRKHLSCLAR